MTSKRNMWKCTRTSETVLCHKRYIHGYGTRHDEAWHDTSEKAIRRCDVCDWQRDSSKSYRTKSLELKRGMAGVMYW
jgi:hypothetical protein